MAARTPVPSTLSEAGDFGVQPCWRRIARRCPELVADAARTLFRR
jgi:hypothetical protein